jgi:hypothetical protein
MGGSIGAGISVTARTDRAVIARLGLVQSLDCFFGTLNHLDKCEPAAVARLAVRANCCAEHTAIWGEHLPQLIGGGIERQVSNIKLLQNVLTFGPEPGKEGRRADVAVAGLVPLAD